MPIHSFSFSVLPTSTSRLLGEIIFILVTRRSMISMGRSNSSTMQMGMAPPQGCARGRGARGPSSHSDRSAARAQRRPPARWLGNSYPLAFSML